MEKARAAENVNTTEYNPLSWVDEHGDVLYKFCRSLTYSKEDAEDLFQETFLKVLQQPNKMQLSVNPQGFLFSTAIYIWKSTKRKYARRKRIAPEEELDDGVCGTYNIEETFIAKEKNRLVRELVEALPEIFRIPIILYYTSEFSVPQIAKTLKLPAGTIKSRLYKARKIVEKGISDYEK